MKYIFNDFFFNLLQGNIDEMTFILFNKIFAR